jgi:hypothetical protein
MVTGSHIPTINGIKFNTAGRDYEGRRGGDTRADVEYPQCSYRCLSPEDDRAKVAYALLSDFFGADALAGMCVRV